MDFDNLTLLQKFPSNSFSNIVFDLSVWKFFRNRGAVLEDFFRMLKKGGKLYYDDGSSVATYQPPSDKLYTYSKIIDRGGDVPRGLIYTGSYARLSANEKVLATI